MSIPPLTLTAAIERKQASLPRYVVVPSSLLEPWALSVATVVELAINGLAVGRRTLKRWDDERWFFELPQPVCNSCGVDTGDRAHFELRLASGDLAPEVPRGRARS